MIILLLNIILEIAVFLLIFIIITVSIKQIMCLTLKIEMIYNFKKIIKIHY